MWNINKKAITWFLIGAIFGSIVWGSLFISMIKENL
jgi:hypothetical protein